MSGLFDGLSDFGADVSAELKRMGTQGSMELANALFNGSAFVPYGPGQYTPTPEIEKPAPEQSMEVQQHSNEGIER